MLLRPRLAAGRGEYTPSFPRARHTWRQHALDPAPRLTGPHVARSRRLPPVSMRAPTPFALAATPRGHDVEQAEAGTHLEGGGTRERARAREREREASGRRTWPSCAAPPLRPRPVMTACPPCPRALADRRCAVAPLRPHAVHKQRGVAGVHVWRLRPSTPARPERRAVQARHERPVGLLLAED